MSEVDRRDRLAGVRLVGNRVETRRAGGPVAGAHAHVDVDGGYTQRFTATRFLTLGPLALIAPKKRDRRHVHLTVEGQGFAFTVRVPRTQERRAYEFAARINARASRSPVSAPPAPPRPNR